MGCKSSVDKGPQAVGGGTTLAQASPEEPVLCICIRYTEWINITPQSSIYLCSWDKTRNQEPRHGVMVQQFDICLK